MKTTQNSTPVILITGATGSVGTELVKTLSEASVPIRVMLRPGRDAGQFAAFPNVRVVAGDFNDSPSLAQALAGVERAFLLTPSSEKAEQQQLAFVREAQKAGVRHLVKLSQLGADVQSPVRFLRYHAVVEEAIRQSGLAYTFLRPNLFMQGLLNFRGSIAGQGKFFAPIGDAHVSLIDVRDIAAVAAVVLTQPGHDNTVYTLTGPQALTHADVADELSVALARTVTFVDIPPQAMRSALAGAGFPGWQADGLIEDYAHYSRGEAAALTPDVQTVTGTLPRSFAQFARDYAGAFS